MNLFDQHSLCKLTIHCILLRTYERHEKIFIENRSIRNRKSRKKILKERKSFLIAKCFTQFAFGDGGDC